MNPPKSSIVLWVVAGVVLLSAFTVLPDIGTFAACLVVALILAGVGYFICLKHKAAAQEAARAQVEAARMQAEREMRAAEYRAKHGELRISVVGVTFDNDDGSSRQRILKAIYQENNLGINATADATLERYEYKGKPAVRVLVDERCIGNIGRDDLPQVLSVLDRVEQVSADIEHFANDDDEKIYRADLIITYSK
jgi:hypothetical protein